MGTKAFSFNSQAKYRSSGHFKEKADILSLTYQEIMVDDKGCHFKAMFPDIFADYQNPPLTGDVAMTNKAWQIWQNTPFSWWQCQLKFALWCASAGCGDSFEDHLQAEKPLLARLYRFHVYHTTRRRLEELRVALQGDKSYSWYENAYDLRAYKRLCAEFGVPPEQDWRQKLDHGCQGLGSWSTFMTPSGAYTYAHVAQVQFYTRRMPCVTTVISQEPGRRLFLTNRRASRRRMCSVFMNRSAHMFVLSWERKPRRGRICSRPGRDLTSRNNFWQISKTRLPHPLTSPAASLATSKH